MCFRNNSAHLLNESVTLHIDLEDVVLPISAQKLGKAKMN